MSYRHSCYLIWTNFFIVFGEMDALDTRFFQTVIKGCFLRYAVYSFKAMCTSIQLIIKMPFYMSIIYLWHFCNVSYAERVFLTFPSKCWNSNFPLRSRGKLISFVMLPINRWINFENFQCIGFILKMIYMI